MIVSKYEQFDYLSQCIVDMSPKFFFQLSIFVQFNTNLTLVSRHFVTLAGSKVRTEFLFDKLSEMLRWFICSCCLAFLGFLCCSRFIVVNSELAFSCLLHNMSRAYALYSTQQKIQPLVIFVHLTKNEQFLFLSFHFRDHKWARAHIKFVNFFLLIDVNWTNLILVVPSKVIKFAICPWYIQFSLFFLKYVLVILFLFKFSCHCMTSIVGFI